MRQVSQRVIGYGGGIAHPGICCSVVASKIQNCACGGWRVNVEHLDCYPKVDDITDEFQRVGVKARRRRTQGFAVSGDRFHFEFCSDELSMYDAPHETKDFGPASESII